MSTEKVVTRPHQGADTAWDDDGGGSRDGQTAVCWWDIPPMVEKYIKDAEGWVVWPAVASHVRQQLLCRTMAPIFCGTHQNAVGHANLSELLRDAATLGTMLCNAYTLKARAGRN